jgi:hypothetical protein
LFCVGLVGYAAGAARAAGRWPESAASLFLSRGSAVLSLYAVIFIVALLALATAIGVYVAGGRHDEMVQNVGAGIWSLTVFVLFTRLWPVLVAVFLYPGRAAYSKPRRQTTWQGPGLVVAWKMTAQRGSFLRASLPFGIIVLGAAVATGTATVLVAGHAPIAMVVVKLVVYCGLLPILVGLADTLGEQLKVPTQWQRDPYPPPPMTDEERQRSR